ncbi:MAG: glycosyltransferase family 4 protein [Candidatus Bathyarchaeia archaeon]
MKIAVLAPFLIPTHPAGGQMLKVVQALASEYEFTVFGRIIDDSLKSKVQFWKIPIPVMRPRLFAYLTQFLYYGYVFKQLGLHKRFDIVHSIEGTSPFATLVTMHFCGWRALNLIQKGTFQIRGIRHPYYKLLYRLGGEIERRVVNNPYLRKLVVVSNGLKRDILQYYHPSLEPVVIPNSVDIKRFANVKQYRKAIRQKLGLKDEELVGTICALGDWERKGLRILIEALTLLPRGAVKIIVIGKGPIEEYRRFCERKKVGREFIFVGFVQDVERYYGAADFFILPTTYEAWSIATLEAAAAGLPLLVTRVSGVEDFVEDGINGLFIEREPRSIASTIASLINERQRMQEMGIEAQRRVQAFSVENMVNAYRKLYEEIIYNK